MSKGRIIQYIIYATIVIIAINVGKSMFSDDRIVRNVSQDVSHETTSDTNASGTSEAEKKLAFELKNTEPVTTLAAKYDEATIKQSKQLAEQFVRWAFPYDEQPKDVVEIKGFVSKDVYEAVLSGRVTNARATRTLTSLETFEAYDQQDEIHWVVRVSGDVLTQDGQKLETVTYDYHVFLTSSDRLWITKWQPQKVS